jgi:nickel-dependent lactate racemase
VASATRLALSEPLDFPPLSAGIVPGDRVAIALDEAVPCAASVVRGAVELIRTAGIEDESICVVTEDVETSQLCRGELSQQGETAVKFVVHDPDEERELCMVGLTKKHGPLVVNRAIFDADVVLPIGCARLDDAGVYDCLYPRFSNSETLQRFRTPLTGNTQTSHRDRTRETDEAGWLIGAPLVIEVVPGSDETVAHVIAGEPHAVARKAEQLTQEQWALQSPQRASLVIAIVTGGASSQNWNNVGRALAAAERLVTEDGAVAICSNLDTPPGESLGRLIGSQELDRSERKIMRDHARDSWPAWHLVRALQRGPVYFLSQLDAETVEDLGMAPVADIEELSRLAGRHESYIVLNDAQHTVATVDGEEDEA